MRGINNLGEIHMKVGELLGKKYQEKTLRESEDYDLVLIQESFFLEKDEGEMELSRYILKPHKDMGYKISLEVPFPENDSYLEFLYSKFQEGFKNFMENVFLVLTKETNSFNNPDKSQKDLLDYTQANDGTVFLFAMKDGKEFCHIGSIISEDPKNAVKAADIFLDFFEKESVGNTLEEL